MKQIIRYKKKILAIIVRNAISNKKKGIQFFSPNNFNQQLGLFNHESGKVIKPHSHNKFIRKIKMFNYLKLLPVFKKSRLSDAIILKEVNNLKVSEVDNKLISKIIDSSEKNLAKQKIGLVRDESWFKWRIIECPYKKDIFLLNYNDIYLITHIIKKNNLNVLNIIFSTEIINSDLINALKVFSKKNNIDYLTFIEKRNNLTDGLFPGERKLNFAFYSENELIISKINKDLNDIQYIDSDLDFI